ncbi:unnamed protein product, partial [Rotaria socialis]
DDDLDLRPEDFDWLIERGGFSGDVGGLDPSTK